MPELNMNLAAGIANKQLKMNTSADNNECKLHVARRIAADIAANGPVTIDDVMEKMFIQYPDVAPKKGRTDRSNAWKGSVFTGRDWVCVGTTPTRTASSNARPVNRWALKSWLSTHSMNGSRSNISSFVLSSVYKDFTSAFPGLQPTDMQWYIGTCALSDDIKSMIERASKFLYGAEVNFVPGVGCVLVRKLK